MFTGFFIAFVSTISKYWKDFGLILNKKECLVNYICYNEGYVEQYIREVCTTKFSIETN